MLKSFCASTIVSYLEKTYNYYLHFQLPNIERHFASLIMRSGDNNNLGLMKRFFDELKGDIINRINQDTQQWFPKIKSSNIKIDNSTSILDKLNDLKACSLYTFQVATTLTCAMGLSVQLFCLKKIFARTTAYAIAF